MPNSWRCHPQPHLLHSIPGFPGILFILNRNCRWPRRTTRGPSEGSCHLLNTSQVREGIFCPHMPHQFPRRRSHSTFHCSILVWGQPVCCQEERRGPSSDCSWRSGPPPRLQVHGIPSAVKGGGLPQASPVWCWGPRRLRRCCPCHQHPLQRRQHPDLE
jgi:hypothetical protein